MGWSQNAQILKAAKGEFSEPCGLRNVNLERSIEAFRQESQSHEGLSGRLQNTRAPEPQTRATLYSKHNRLLSFYTDEFCDDAVSLWKRRLEEHWLWYLTCPLNVLSIFSIYFVIYISLSSLVKRASEVRHCMDNKEGKRPQTSDCSGVQQSGGVGP